MSEKVAFGVKPGTARPETSKVDEWVNHRDAETLRWLTIIVPTSVHAPIKRPCAWRSVKMTDEVRNLSAKRFAS